MQLSVVVIVYNIRREAPRTLLSLSAAHQRVISAEDYEVIVVENGSSEPLEESAVLAHGDNFQYHYLKDASPSPAHALNFGMQKARGEVIGLMIDGARICTPGLLACALAGTRAYRRAIIGTMGFYLGEGFQRFAIMKGYNPAEEDRLLERIAWPKDGYRLFEIGSRDESSPWFTHLAESNALFMPRALWQELGGVDERFDLPGGGLVNLDTFARACELPDCELVVPLGEATFHQVHGGVATNTRPEVHEENLARWQAQYLQLRGKHLTWPTKPRKWLGTLPMPALPHLLTEAGHVLEDQERIQLDRELRAARAALEQLNQRAAQLAADRDRIKSELDMIHWSTSWAVTKPLRSAFRHYGNLRGHLTRLTEAASVNAKRALGREAHLAALHASNRRSADAAIERKLVNLRAQVFARKTDVKYIPVTPPEKDRSVVSVNGAAQARSGLAVRATGGEPHRRTDSASPAGGEPHRPTDSDSPAGGEPHERTGSDSPAGGEPHGTTGSDPAMGARLGGEPPSSRSVFGVPVADAGQLGVRRLREAMGSHGLLHVRGLLDAQRIAHLCGVIDSALAAQEAAHGGAARSSTTPWYDPSELVIGGKVARDFVRANGSVLAVDTPRGMFQLLEMLYGLGLDQLVTDYFGERPALSAEKTTLRRVITEAAPAGWHQDGRFLGTDIRSLNIWIALSDCGTDAPGLELVPARLSRIVPTGIEGADYDWSVSQSVVEREFPGAAICPEFRAGDALIFDHFLLHRTHRNLKMTRPRYALENWFFAPSAYPESQTGLYI